MIILRFLALLIFAAFLAACAAHVPVFDTQDNILPVSETQYDIPATTAQPDRTSTAKAKSEAKKSKSATTAASATPHEDTKHSIPLNVGSPEKWDKERAEEERKEQQLKQVIEGICRGC